MRTLFAHMSASSMYSPYGANFMSGPDLQECTFVTSETETASAYVPHNAAVYEKLNDDAMRAMLARVGHGRVHVGSMKQAPISPVVRGEGRTNPLYRSSSTASSYALPPTSTGPVRTIPDMDIVPTSRMHKRLLRPEYAAAKAQAEAGLGGAV